MLPQEEIDRIEIVPNVRGRHFVMKEASLWYERMRKFAEMAGAVSIGDERWVYIDTAEKWFCGSDKLNLTTPELINEFLKHKP